MVRTKHALYVDGCDPSHEGPSPSHEGDDDGERHRRLTVSARGHQHPPIEPKLEPKPQTVTRAYDRIIVPPFGRGPVDVSLI